jgi:hypothetical protein
MAAFIIFPSFLLFFFYSGEHITGFDLTLAAPVIIREV